MEKRVCLYKIQNVCTSSWITRETDDSSEISSMIRRDCMCAVVDRTACNRTIDKVKNDGTKLFMKHMTISETFENHRYFVNS